jgi:toxin ParE1/3/4
MAGLKGTREIMAHPNDIVVHQVVRNELRIIALLHVRQEYP